MAGLAILAACIVYLVTWIRPAARPRLASYVVKSERAERTLIDVAGFENDCAEGSRSYYLDRALANEVEPAVLYCVSRHNDAGTVHDYLSRLTLDDHDGQRKQRRLRNATSLLTAMGEPAVDALCGYLGDAREPVRRVVSRALLAMESPTARACLHDAFESTDPLVRVTGAHALRRSLATAQITPETGWQVLLKLLSDPDPYVRVQALDTLVIFGPEIAAPAAERLKDDPDGAVREAARQTEGAIANVLRREKLLGKGALSESQALELNASHPGRRTPATRATSPLYAFQELQDDKIRSATDDHDFRRLK